MIGEKKEHKAEEVEDKGEGGEYNTRWREKKRARRGRCTRYCTRQNPSGFESPGVQLPSLATF